MRVILAYPHDGHAPDEEVDLDDVEARRLLRDGTARLPDGVTPPPTGGDVVTPSTTEGTPAKEPAKTRGAPRG